MKKVALILAAGFEEVEAVTPVDFLRRAGIEVTIATLEAGAIVGSNGVSILGDCSLSELPADLDGLILPGGMPGAQNLAQSCALTALLQQFDQQQKLIAAICAAPALVLGGAGLLSGRTFTCYPGFEDQVTGAHFSTERVVQDEHIITSRGPGSAAEFSLAVITYLIGSEAANTVKQGTLQPF